MEFIELGLISFEDAWGLQQEAAERIVSEDGPEKVFLLQHPHIFTLGRGADESHVLRPQDFDGTPIPVKRIGRGGEVTYHGPGQLVAYPQLDLRRRGRDVHRYLRQLEEAIIRCCADFGVMGFRREGLTGVWTEAGKLASIGVGVRRWVTLHGLALNVSTDLRYFQLIDPCGMPDCEVTSLSRLVGRPVEVAEVLPSFCRAFEEVFAVEAHVGKPPGT